MGTFATSRRPAAPAGAANSGLRVRDSDRVDACALLDAARDDGQLSDSEHGRRTAAAMRARTFADVEKVIGDLQIPANMADAPVVRPARRRRARRWVLAGGAVAAAALIGMFCGWVSSDDGPLADHTPPDMTTAAGIEAFLSDYRQHYGDLLADDVTLMPENASIERPRTGIGRFPKELPTRENSIPGRPAAGIRNSSRSTSPRSMCRNWRPCWPELREPSGRRRRRSAI